MEHVVSGAFWLALAKIIWVNLLLSGDNAIVIAMAARGLPAHQRTKAVAGGSAAAIALRVALTLFAAQMLQYPFLKLVGAALLLWIGVQLLLPADEADAGTPAASQLGSAIRIILIADLAMSLDNVIAVAAAAQSGPASAQTLLLVLGLSLSIPLIVFGSQLLLAVMEKLPIVVTLGAALLGFVAGEMLVSDPAVAPWFDGLGGAPLLALKTGCALAVVAVGRWLAARRGAAGPTPGAA